MKYILLAFILNLVASTYKVNVKYESYGPVPGKKLPKDYSKVILTFTETIVQSRDISLFDSMIVSTETRAERIISMYCSMNDGAIMGYNSSNIPVLLDKGNNAHYEPKFKNDFFFASAYGSDNKIIALNEGDNEFSEKMGSYMTVCAGTRLIGVIVLPFHKLSGFEMNHLAGDAFNDMIKVHLPINCMDEKCGGCEAVFGYRSALKRAISARATKLTAEKQAPASNAQKFEEIIKDKDVEENYAKIAELAAAEDQLCKDKALLALMLTPVEVANALPQVKQDMVII